uniref:Novel immune-type receptor 3b n=1 Tax=Sinocyclocheilus anshuiensis TaxID=1608454 RepID=A0A671M1X4_9TELE
MEQLLVAELGCSVIIPCSHSDDFINTVSWYKHSLGKKPSGTGSFNLTIIHLEEYDSATYYCAVSFLNIITFGEGTILLRKGERTTVLQQPVSDRLHPGDSVTLQCSVISQICAGEYSVYWFRHSSGHSDPGIIYTHDNRSDQSMERSESSSSTQSYAMHTVLIWLTTASYWESERLEQKSCMSLRSSHPACFNTKLDK